MLSRKAPRVPRLCTRDGCDGYSRSGEITRMLKRRTLASAVLGLSLICTATHADDDNGLNDIFTNGHVDGDLRLYNFNRLYASKTTPNASAFSIGALINAQTGTFLTGFSIGGSFATVNSLGTHSDTPAKIDTTL